MREFSVQALPVSRESLPYSYREGCPIAPTELVQVRFIHCAAGGTEAVGNLVVHAVIAQRVAKVLKIAYRMNYKIEKAVPIDNDLYRGNDEMSMKDNNSSAFNYRPIAGTDTISMHSRGLAIDINPALNPYLARDGIWYPSAEYSDRAKLTPGMLTETHPVVEAFAEQGFEWGGTWVRPDYHHFEYSNNV